VWINLAQQTEGAANLFYSYYANRARADQVAIKQVLAHLGLSPPEEPKPPPALHEVVRMPVDAEGREMQAP
jgi:hypothetical protein